MFTKYTIIISELLTIHKRIPLSRKTSDTKRFFTITEAFMKQMFLLITENFRTFPCSFSVHSVFSTRNGSFLVIRNPHVKIYIFNNYIKLSALILILKLIKLTSTLFC